MIKKISANYSDKHSGLDNKYYLFGIDDAIIIPAIVAAGGVVVGSLINASSSSHTNKENVEAQKDINEENVEAQKSINQEQLDYAAAMTQAQWERDDTAHQRQVADLQAAGLSPLANTQGSEVTAAQSFNPQSEAVAVAPQKQAPQFDINSLVNASLGAMQLGEKFKEHKDKLIREDRSLDLEAEKLSQNLIELNIKDQEVAVEFQRLSDAMLMHIDNIEMTKAQLEQAKDLKEREFFEQKLADNQKAINEAIQNAEKLGITIHPYYTIESAERAFQSWIEQFNIFLKSLKKSKSKFFGFGFGANGSQNGISAGGNLNVNGGYTTNDNYEMQALRKFTAEHPMPQFVKTR